MLPESLLHSTYFWLAIVPAVIYIYLKLVIYTYWSNHGVPHEPPKIIFGNMLPIALGKISLGDFFKKSYVKFKDHRFHGIYVFHKPQLVINDPELIRHFLVKEFHRFQERGVYCNKNVDPLSNNLFFMPMGKHEKWRKLRAKFSPIFTPSNLKQIFPLLKKIGDHLIKTCDETLLNDGVVEIKDLMSRYTIDSISSIAFGFDCKSLDNPENEFKRHGAMVVNQNPITNALTAFAPIILDIFRIPFFDRQVNIFFSKTFYEMIKYRKENNITRKDFLNLLMQLMDKGVLDDEENKTASKEVSDGNTITMAEAQAQAFMFFIAGYETTSSTIVYLLYELAMNPDIQQKLHEEIYAFHSNGEMTYDRINNDLKYLDMVFSETLRKHPVFSFLNRKCTEDYQIPNSNFTVEKGTGIIIPVIGLHHDPNIYPNPEIFDPMRFDKENVAARSPYVYLPFGSGPRNCIGARLGELQSKISLIMLLSNYRFLACEKTIIPIQYSKRSFTQTPACGIHLRLEKRIQ